MNPHQIDARRFIQDHEVFLTLLDRPAWTHAELASLESLESLLGKLREKLLEGDTWDYTPTRLEEARSLECQIRADEDHDAAKSFWKQLEPFGRVFLSALLARLVVGGLSRLFKAKLSEVEHLRRSSSAKCAVLHSRAT